MSAADDGGVCGEAARLQMERAAATQLYRPAHFCEIADLAHEPIGPLFRPGFLAAGVSGFAWNSSDVRGSARVSKRAERSRRS